MERVTGIEPVLFAWEANVIPFHHTRKWRNYSLVAIKCQIQETAVLPLHLSFFRL